MGYSLQLNKYQLKEVNTFRRSMGMKEIVIENKKCLKCKKKFRSEDIKNMMCPACGRLEEYDDES